MAEQNSFENMLESLQDARREFPKRYLQQFSDIAPQDLKSLLGVWPRVNPRRKIMLLDGFLSLMDSDTLVSFEDIGHALLGDSDGEVRARAIRLLAESDDPNLVGVLIEILKNDADLPPRLASATMLGEFVLLGELDKLPENLHHEAEDALMAVITSEEHVSLRKLALEAVGYSSRPEVDTLINSAFNREDPTWVASALVAMGRTNDSQWGEQVVGMLMHIDRRIRLAAVQAAGELSLDEARPIILGMLLEGEEEDEVIAAAIWSLSEIGGEEVRTFLVDLLDKTEDEDITGYIEEALENLDFTDELEKFEMLSLDEDELADEE